MIALSHFGNGNRIALNVDLIEKIEETPDTVITLTNGARYLVQESLDEIIEKSIEIRARAIYMAQHLSDPSERQQLRLLHGGDDPEQAEHAERSQTDGQAEPEGSRPGGSES